MTELHKHKHYDRQHNYNHPLWPRRVPETTRSNWTGQKRRQDSKNMWRTDWMCCWQFIWSRQLVQPVGCIRSALRKQQGKLTFWTDIALSIRTTYIYIYIYTIYIYIWTVEKLRSSKITNFNPQTHCSQRRIRLAFGTRNCKTNSQRSYQLFNTPNIYQEGGWGCKNEYSVAINLISCAAQTDTKWSPHSSWHSDEEYPHTKTVAAGHDVMITIHSCLTHQFPAGVHHLCNSVRRCANRSARNCYTCPGRAHVVRWRQVAMAHSQPITCILLNGRHRANHLNTIKWHTHSQPPEYY